MSNLRITGLVQLVLRQPSRSARIEAANVDVVSADARLYSEQQLKYGVVVEQGAFTIYNFNSNPDSLITATLDNISVGRLEAPVVGSGIYIAGFSDEGGKVEVDTMTTGEVHSTGMIPQGQPNRITGGIFILSGAHVRELVSKEVVYTYGVNDMTLDVWGEVDSWITEKPVRSFDTSGIGDSLVKGVIMKLEATALSLQPGAKVKKLEVGGDLVTHGDKLTSVRVNGGTVDEFLHHGAIRALGADARDLIVENDGKL